MGLWEFINKLFGRPARPQTPAPPEPRFDPQSGEPVSRPATPPAAAPPSRPQNTTLKLDAAQFTPLAGSAVRQAAEALGPNRFATAFTFGRQNQIPPADDPRTQ